MWHKSVRFGTSARPRIETGPPTKPPTKPPWAVRGRSAQNRASLHCGRNNLERRTTPALEPNLASLRRLWNPPASNHNSIGETGFEPATARPPAGCATRLRHSPWCSSILRTKTATHRAALWIVLGTHVRSILRQDRPTGRHKTEARPRPPPPRDQALEGTLARSRGRRTPSIPRSTPALKLAKSK